MFWQILFSFIPQHSCGYVESLGTTNLSGTFRWPWIPLKCSIAVRMRSQPYELAPFFPPLVFITGARRMAAEVAAAAAAGGSGGALAPAAAAAVAAAGTAGSSATPLLLLLLDAGAESSKLVPLKCTV
jgi:hypothetical protein